MGVLDRLFDRQPKRGRPRPTSQATFDKDVLLSPRPVVVDFWAGWCVPCQVMGGLLDEVGPAYAGRIDFYKLDIEQSPEIAAEYGARSIPTLVFFHNGGAVHRVVGLIPLHPLQEKLDHLASLAGEDGEAQS